MIFFTSDTHFSHTNVISYCNRPFTSREHMDETMITRWNERVGRSDVIYHLGDFAMTRYPDDILRRLNGQIHLILGNHDSKNRRQLRNSTELSSVRDVLELRVATHTIWLSHYAHARWPKAHYGSFHLFGHSHGQFEGLGRSMDVGVDTNNFYPYELSEIIDRLQNKIPVEHHGED